jgi:hypothetical protein
MFWPRSRLALFGLMAITLTRPAEAQEGFLQDLMSTILEPFNNFFRPINLAWASFTRNAFRVGVGSSSAAELRAEGKDKLFPDDCGRQDDGTGKLCFGDPDLCNASKYQGNA